MPATSPVDCMQFPTPACAGRGRDDGRQRAGGGAGRPLGDPRLAVNPAFTPLVLHSGTVEKVRRGIHFAGASPTLGREDAGKPLTERWRLGKKQPARRSVGCCRSVGAGFPGEQRGATAAVGSRRSAGPRNPRATAGRLAASKRRSAPARGRRAFAKRESPGASTRSSPFSCYVVGWWRRDRPDPVSRSGPTLRPEIPGKGAAKGCRPQGKSFSAVNGRFTRRDFPAAVPGVSVRGMMVGGSVESGVATAFRRALATVPRVPAGLRGGFRPWRSGRRRGEADRAAQVEGQHPEAEIDRTAGAGEVVRLLRRAEHRLDAGRTVVTTKFAPRCHGRSPRRKAGLCR